MIKKLLKSIFRFIVTIASHCKSFVIFVQKKHSFASYIYYLRLNCRKKVSITEFFNYRFESFGKNLSDSFLSYAKAEEYWEVLNPLKYASIARDKFISHCLFEKLAIPSPKLFCVYNQESSSNESVICYNNFRIQNAIRESNNVVIKPAADSAHGKGVAIYDIKDFVEFKGNVPLDSILNKEALLFESCIKQNEQFSSFNDSSVNTIRMMTALYPNHEIKLIAAFIKIGRAGSVVDNAGNGGNIDCAIDIETGMLYNALQFNSWEDIRSIECHPDSGEQLNGTIIKDWETIKQKVLEWQGRIPYLKTIGWDVAVTDQGPVAIEINNWWDTTGQLFIGKGWAPQVKDCYDAWVNYYKQNS